MMLPLGYLINTWEPLKQRSKYRAEREKAAKAKAKRPRKAAKRAKAVRHG